MRSLNAHTESQLRSKWPDLFNNYEKTSNETKVYNCVAWALKIEDDWIQHDYHDDGEPDRDHFVESYIEIFKGEGFAICENGDLEDGFEKIVIYFVEASNEFTHVARQLEDGNWTSKMGPFEDISHYSPEILSGPFYGKPHSYMRRKKSPVI